MLMTKQVPMLFSETISSSYMDLRASTSSCWMVWHSKGERLILGGGVLSVFYLKGSYEDNTPTHTHTHTQIIYCDVQH